MADKIMPLEEFIDKRGTEHGEDHREMLRAFVERYDRVGGYSDYNVIMIEDEPEKSIILGHWDEAEDFDAFLDMIRNDERLRGSGLYGSLARRHDWPVVMFGEYSELFFGDSEWRITVEPQDGDPGFLGRWDLIEGQIGKSKDGTYFIVPKENQRYLRVTHGYQNNIGQLYFMGEVNGKVFVRCEGARWELALNGRFGVNFTFDGILLEQWG